MRLVPTLDYIVVEREAAKEKSAGGIILPESVGQPAGRGTVVARGPGRFDNGSFVETTVRPESSVIFSEAMVEEVELDGKKFLLMREHNIMATIEK